MTRGSKEQYTQKQKRKAQHIEEGYVDQGVEASEAERRAWATVNKSDGGGLKLLPAEKEESPKKSPAQLNGPSIPRRAKKSSSSSKMATSSTRKKTAGSVARQKKVSKKT